MIDYTTFRQALFNLSQQYANYHNTAHRLSLSPLDQEALAESCIQRFEICYDRLWKTLKRYLNEHLGLPNLPNSPKPIFRLAYENRLLSSLEDWLNYADMRTDTTHDYSQLKASQCLEKLSSFIIDATSLLQCMAPDKP